MEKFLYEHIGIMIHQADLALTNFAKTKLAPLHITPEQNLIILLLLEKDGVTQNEIAKKLYKEKTNIARMISNLEKKGMIYRKVNELDQRSLHVYLTENGKRLSEKIYPIVEEHDRAVCTGITPEELATVREVLIKMMRNTEI